MNYSFLKKDGLFLKVVEALVDVFLVIIGFYSAFYLRFNFQPSLKNIQPFYEIIPYIAIITVVVFIFTHMFSMLRKSIIDVVFNLFISLFAINIITAGIVFFARGFTFPRSVFIIAFIIQYIALFVFKLIILWALKKNYQKKKIIIIGNKEDSQNIARKLLLNKNNLDNLRYICSALDNNLYNYIDEVDKVYVGSSIDNKSKSDIIAYCIGKDKVVYIVPELFEIAMVNTKTAQIDDIPVFEIDNLHLSMEDLIVKRLFDLVLSTIGLLFALPIMGALAIIIKFYDHGSVLYKQRRVTQGNREFNLYKFRTMIVDAEKKTGPVLATEKDPRITPLGRVLRATRLDELPQLFNVFKGDMSIVGPRPERQHFIEQFVEEIPIFKYRVVVKAGVTGLAQVLGKYTTSPEDKVRFDLLYIRDYSLLLDIKIIIKTIKVIFSKESSNGFKDKQSLNDVFREMNIKVSEEIGVTRLD